MTTHYHQAVESLADYRGWDHCVSPRACAWDLFRRQAHHRVIRIDTCLCGAKREVEITAGNVNYGEWNSPLIGRLAVELFDRDRVASFPETVLG